MYFKMDFIDGTSLNNFELKIKPGLPCIRFSGLKFKSFDAVNRINSIFKALKVPLPKKTLLVSFKEPVNYNQYREVEFFIVWAYMYIDGKLPRPKFYQVAGLSLSLNAEVIVKDSEFTFLQFVNYIHSDKHKNLQICFEKNLSKVINLLLSKKCNILLLGPYGEGKTTELLNHKNSATPVLSLNSSNTSLDIKRLIGSIDSNSKLLVLVDELSDYTIKSINLFKILFDKTLFPNVTILASSNPCRCGFFKSQMDVCSCSQLSLYQFYKNLSAGIIDRFSAVIYYDQNTNSKFKSLIEQDSIDDFNINKNIKILCNKYKLNPRKKSQFLIVLSAFSEKYSSSIAFSLTEFVMFGFSSIMNE